MAVVHELIEIPRALLTKYQHMPYAEMRAAAERGDDGLRIVSSGGFGFSYYRKPDKGGMLDGDGAASLFCQGWVA